jgi:hypothetical protein
MMDSMSSLERLGGISKQGDRYLRLLVIGATGPLFDTLGTIRRASTPTIRPNWEMRSHAGRPKRRKPKRLSGDLFIKNASFNSKSGSRFSRGLETVIVTLRLSYSMPPSGT